jgi:acyl-coenzyme A synthetase/AMP-(fatty) acid ligase
MAALSYGGVLIAPDGRQPEAVARTVERARVELLPVTPTFLNLLLAAGSAAEHDMSSVALISYGTEVMTEATLAHITKLFPNARFQQTYGLSELGILPLEVARFRLTGSSSGASFETKVVGSSSRPIRVRDGGLSERPQPLRCRGWFNTGDAVEQNTASTEIWGAVPR